MKQFSTVFNQILQLLPQHEFDTVIKKFQTDRYVKHFKTKCLFVVHLYAHIRKKDSLRDILCGLKQQESAWYHIGLKKLAKSTISDANNRIDYRVYEHLFHHMLKKCDFKSNHGFNFDNKLYALDATVIDLCLSVFDWAKFRRKKGAIKMHCLYDIKEQLPVFNVITEGSTHEANVAKGNPFELSPDSIVVFDRAYLDYAQFYTYHKQGVYFVTRAKNNSRFNFLGQHSFPTEKGLQFDHAVTISDPSGQSKYPEKMRLVGFFDHKNNKTYQFLTNNFILSAHDIAQIYKARWDIELFFKWIKQNLKIKSFLGTSRNAVLSQVWIAMIYYLLLAYIKSVTKQSFSYLKLARIFHETLFFRKHLIQLLFPHSKKPQKPPDFTQLSLC
jgi:hypothetical protein|tara:strand:+ start:133 stop:1290 length:1158 start_codon:yes stop_codon:yes gene_type:complete